MNTRVVARLLLLGCLISGVGCSSYPQDFREAVDGSAGTYEGVYGPWEGEWHSEPSGHRGPLWCLIEQAGEDDTEFSFRYRAGWGRILRGNFTQVTPVVAAAEPGAYEVVATKDLGRLGGVYQIDGVVGPDAFDARFTSSKGDRGTMVLRRPGGTN